MNESKPVSYFGEYGGLNAIVSSPFFWAAVALCGIVSRYFMQPGWWEVVISVVPGLVGFSIAGVAIFISLANDALRSLIAGREPDEKESSPFIKFMAMFTHFIILQLGSFLFAFVAKALYQTTPVGSAALIEAINEYKNIFWLAGDLLFCYATFLTIALVLEIYRLARMIDEFETAHKKQPLVK